jgi:hypothetical protein
VTTAAFPFPAPCTMIDRSSHPTANDHAMEGSPPSAHVPPQTFGELVPLGGGDPIPLLRPSLMVGRRESCDIVLKFPNVSGVHCELSISGGHWVVKDLGSSNGTKVNGSRVTEQRVASGDKISFGRHVYEIFYNPALLGADAGGVGDHVPDVFATSLLSAAGLERRRTPRDAAPRR